MSALRKNVASQVLTFNGVNATTGAALTGATITTKVALDGTQSASAGTLTELGTGQYKYVPTQGETNGTSVGFSFTATNMIPVNLHCFTTAQDPTDAVRFGLTALPNVASGSAGAIPTTGTGSNQISVTSGQVILQSGSGTGQLDFTSGVVKANATQWVSGTIPAVNVTGVPKVDVVDWLGSAPNALNSGLVQSDTERWLNGAIPTVNVTGVPLVDLKYTLGTISPATAGSVRADAVTGAVGSVTGAVGSVTGAVGSVTGNVGGNVTGSVGSISGVTFPTNFSAFSIDANGRIKALTEITKNVALANFMFQMTDATTHAPKTGVTVAGTVSLDGGAFAAVTNAITEVSGGWYKLNLAAADVNGNVVALRFTGTASDDTNISIVTSQ